MDGVTLTFDDDALQAIAGLAIERNTGARGLRSIMEGIMMDIMYEVPSRPEIAEVVIHENCVTKQEKPEYILREIVDLEAPKIAGELTE